MEIGVLLLPSRFSHVRLDVTHRRKPTRLRPWDSPGKNTGVGCLCLLQEIGVKRELVSREPQTQYMVRGVSNKCRGLSTKTGEGSWRALLLHEMARENLADTVTVEQISEDEKGSGVGA